MGTGVFKKASNLFKQIIDQYKSSSDSNVNSNEIMDIVVPSRIGKSNYLVDYYGALHGDVGYTL